MTSHIDLAERIEAAEGPDRELDFDICKAVRSYPSDWRTRLRGASLEYYLAWSDCALRYTASIDAALALVPEGWHWQVIADQHNNASVWQPGDEFCKMGHAATPALALCAAALRAHAVKGEG